MVKVMDRRAGDYIVHGMVVDVVKSGQEYIVYLDSGYSIQIYEAEVRAIEEARNEETTDIHSS